jgi:hypothetical protein
MISESRYFDSELDALNEIKNQREANPEHNSINLKATTEFYGRQ